MFEDFSLPTKEDLYRVVENNRDEAIAIAREKYDEFKESLQKGIADVIFFEGSPGEKFLGISWRGMVDRFGQVYMTVSLYMGAGIGFGGVGGIKLFGNKNNMMSKGDMALYLTDFGCGISLYGGVGGGISIGGKGAAAEIGIQANIAANINVGWIKQVGTI